MENLLEAFQLGIHRAVSHLGFGFTNYRHPLRRQAWAHSLSAMNIGSGTTPLECSELHSAVRACQKIPGGLAEAGVYMGATAAVMLSASEGKQIHFFDTFDGLPGSENQFKQGEWNARIEAVRINLTRWSDRIEFHPGFFPESARGLEHLVFSFVHLDLDLYQSTIDALHWFWPRLTPGGAFLSHDYPLSAGVVRAFHEFFADQSIPFFPLSGQQVLAVKLSPR